MKAKKVKDDFPPHIQMMLYVFRAADDCRRENNALRNILHKQGLSHSAIRSRVKRLLKKPDEDVSGAQIVKQACEATMKLYREYDGQLILGDIEPQGDVQ